MLRGNEVRVVGGTHTCYSGSWMRRWDWGSWGCRGNRAAGNQVLSVLLNVHMLFVKLQILLGINL